MKRLVAVLSVAVVGFSPGVANGATALIVGGKGDYATLTDEQMSTALGGYFADDTRVSVPFPGTADFRHSTEVGEANLYQAIYSTPGPKIIGGVSEGVAAVEEVLRRLMQDQNRPGRDELAVVIYGRPNATLYRFGGVKYQPLPDTPYDILVVKAQYDGIADWPDDPFNLLAVMNALMGAQQLHVAAGFYDISTVPKEYISTTPGNNGGGTTTTVLIPTPVLPLLKALADRGNSPELVKMLDSILRPIVDSAYRRPPPAPAALKAAQPGLVAMAEAGIQANHGIDGPFIGDAGRSNGIGHVDGTPGDDAGAQRKLRHAMANTAETGGERSRLEGADELRNGDADGDVTGSGAAVVPERLDIRDDDEADESGPEEQADNGSAATENRDDSATDHAAPPTE